MIYLDNAATTYPKPETVWNAVDYCQRNYAVNVGRGSYPTAMYAAECVEETRKLLAAMVKASRPDNVVLTPSATIAANEIILGLPWDNYKTVYVSPFEHNAIARPLQSACTRFGMEMKTLPFNGISQEWDEDETIRLFELDPPDYIFINHVSNVTGAILPVDKIAEKAKEYGAIVIVDASQSMGLIEYNLQKQKIDYLIFAGHKNLYASWGIGGFIANNTVIRPALYGGTGSDSLNLSMSDSFPIGYEPGSPNIIAISSLKASLTWLNDIGIQSVFNKKKQLMKMLIDGISNEKVHLYLPAKAENHTSVVSFNVDDYEPNEVGMILGNDYDIAVRTGYHCAPFVHKLLDTEKTSGTVRASIGFFNTEEDINALIQAIAEL